MEAREYRTPRGRAVPDSGRRWSSLAACQYFSRRQGHSVGRVRVKCTKVPDGTLSAQFESAVIPLLEPLYRQALRMTSNRMDAEDLVQETVLNAYAGLRAFEPGTNLNAWLRRIMTNTYISSIGGKSAVPQSIRPVRSPIDSYYPMPPARPGAYGRPKTRHSRCCQTPTSRRQ